MAQSVPASADLGPLHTGKAIGITVLNVDRTTYAAFSTSGVSEVISGQGVYAKAGSVTVPDEGGHLVWGTAGTALAEVTVESTAMSSVASVGSGAITSSSFAADSITASAIAANAIGASELASDAVTEIAAAVAAPGATTIADAVWDEPAAGHVTDGTFGALFKKFRMLQRMFFK